MIMVTGHKNEDNQLSVARHYLFTAVDYPIHAILHRVVRRYLFTGEAKTTMFTAYGLPRPPFTDAAMGDTIPTRDLPHPPFTSRAKSLMVPVGRLPDSPFTAGYRASVTQHGSARHPF